MDRDLKSSLELVVQLSDKVAKQEEEIEWLTEALASRTAELYNLSERKNHGISKS